MAIKINGQLAIGNNRRAKFKSVNPGAYSTAPTSVVEVGDVYYNTDEDQLKVWTGQEWK